MELARSPAQYPEFGSVYRTVGGRELLFDNEGFLWNPDDWTADTAEALARDDGLTSLDDAHWRVIRFLRSYYYDHGRAPLNRQLAGGVGISLLNIETLFPGGIKHGARRIAGLPNPKTCL